MNHVHTSHALIASMYTLTLQVFTITFQMLVITMVKIIPNNVTESSHDLEYQVLECTENNVILILCAYSCAIHI